MNYLLQNLIRTIRKIQKDNGTFKKNNQGKGLGHSGGRKVSWKVFNLKAKKANLKLKMTKKARKIQRSRL